MKVSVIIPAYNAQAYIADAIRSVLLQDYAPFEIIVVDDGSTDDTVLIARALAPETRIITQVNAGVAAARNTGIRAAHGDAICFLDADDGWFPGKLAAQVSLLEKHPDVGLVYHRWNVAQADTKGNFDPPPTSSQATPDSVDNSMSGELYPLLLLDSVIHTSTVMVRSDIVSKVGFFDENLVNGEDYDYWIRISRLCRIVKLSATYSFYRTAVRGSLTHHPKDTNYEYLVVQRALRKWGTTAPDGSTVKRAAIQARLGKLAFDFGYQHFHYGDRQLAFRAFLAALMHKPLNLRVLAYLVRAGVAHLDLRNRLVSHTDT